MPAKDFTVKVKAGPQDGLGEGQFTAYASVFGNVDSYGDVVVKGAFAKTLTDWAASGQSLPILWGHNMSDPDMNLGAVLTASEDDHGLLITGQLDPDQIAIPGSKTAQVYRLLKGKRVSQMSFAYDVVEGAAVTKDGESYFELQQLDLYEVSVVPIGANQETEILAVKAAAQALMDGAKVGKVLAAKHLDSLRNARDAIAGVIDAATADQDDTEKAAGTGPASTSADPDGAKSDVEQPSPSPSATNWSTQIQILSLAG
jgi:uncharacterized protein